MLKSLKEKVYEKISADIISGKLTPGQRFTQTELTKKYKVSRSPIREVLNQLSSEGLITANGKKNKYYSVTKLNVREVDEIHCILELLEGSAARLFAERATPKDIDYLQSLNHKLKKLAEAQDIKGFVKENDLMHGYIIKHCGNFHLNWIIDLLRRKTIRYGIIDLTAPKQAEKYCRDHEKIIEACQENDALLAEKLMKQHWQNIRNILIRLLGMLQIL